MEEYIKEFNSLYPQYSLLPFDDSCSISDPNCDHDKDFLQLDITGCRGGLFPMSFAQDSIGFYDKAKSREPMLFNCDGLLMAEIEDNVHLILCELKSAFIPENILHAKEQIVGTLMRLNAQSAILQHTPDWEIHGLIVSYEPSTERLVEISKSDNYSNHFSRNIYSKKHITLDKSRCRSNYYPLNVPSFCIHYLGVPDRQQTYTIDVKELLKL